MAKAFTIIQTIGAGLTYDVQPPVGQDWTVTDIASSAIVGVAPAGVPNVTAGLFDGVNGPALFRNASAANPHVRGWDNPPEWHINNTNYLRITNPEAGGLNIAISVLLGANYGANAASRVISDLAVLGAGGVQAVQPPVGQDWKITDIGSTRWVGAQPAGIPNVAIDVTDGVNAAQIAHGADARGWNRPFEIYLNNTTWMTLTNPVGAGATVGWSGVIIADYGANGQTHVISDTAILGAGGVQLVQPPATEEWVITEIGSSVWVGAAPAALPDVLVQITNGVINATAQDNADNKGWLGRMKYVLTNTNYMSLTDSGGAGCNVGWSGYRQRAT